MSCTSTLKQIKCRIDFSLFLVVLFSSVLLAWTTSLWMLGVTARIQLGYWPSPGTSHAAISGRAFLDMMLEGLFWPIVVSCFGQPILVLTFRKYIRLGLLIFAILSWLTIPILLFLDPFDIFTLVYGLRKCEFPIDVVRRFLCPEVDLSVYCSSSRRQQPLSTWDGRPES